MHDHASGGAGWSIGPWIVLLPFVAAAAIYVGAVFGERSRDRPWPWWRTASWLLGVSVAALAMSPVALSAPGYPFTDHAIRHLLIGMVAPVLLVLAAPMTLALRSFAVSSARRLSRALRSAPARALGHPVVAGLLAVGSLWLLYTTPLFEVTADSFLHLVLMLHFLAAGFLFTAAVAPVDPSPHRASLGMRLVVLALALAAHGVLTKALYASVEAGTGGIAELIRIGDATPADVQTGAQLMYYGGDVVDLALIALVLWGWYRAAGRPRSGRRAADSAVPVAVLQVAPANPRGTA